MATEAWILEKATVGEGDEVANSLADRVLSIQSAVGGLGDGSHVPLFSGGVHYVDAAQADDTGDGQSPDTAKKTIGAAIGIAATGDAITVKSGTYTEEGIDMNLNALELWPEIGVTLDPADGTALTISGNGCKVWCPGGSLKITPGANDTGVQITGTFCYVSDVRVACNSAADIGFHIGDAADNGHGNGAVLDNCRCSSPLIAAFKVQADKVKLQDCCTGGDSGDSSIGFWMTPDASGAIDKTRLNSCGSQGHETAGYQVDTGCTRGVIEGCYSGGGDGQHIDADNAFVWSNFAFDDEAFHLTAFAGAGPSSDNLFQVTGAVEVQYIYGHVETILSANVDDIFLDLWDGAASVEITDNLGGGTDTNSADVGSIFIKNEIATTAITLMQNNQGRIEENTDSKKPHVPFIALQKKDTNTYIRVVYDGVATSGAIHWHCHWEPLTEGSSVVAV